VLPIRLLPATSRVADAHFRAIRRCLTHGRARYNHCEESSCNRELGRPERERCSGDGHADGVQPLMPGYDPTASIYFEDGRWVIHCAFPPDPFETHSVIETQILPLSAETINQVLNSIAEHAVP